jgi:hypothetical protein
MLILTGLRRPFINVVRRNVSRHMEEAGQIFDPTSSRISQDYARRRVASTAGGPVVDFTVPWTPEVVKTSP